jgi:hypothetical protein
MTSIDLSLSSSERARSELDPATLSAGEEIITRNGIIVLRGVIERGLLEEVHFHLRGLEEFVRSKRSPDTSEPFALRAQYRGAGRWDVPLKPVSPLLDPRLFGNWSVLPIILKWLRKDVHIVSIGVVTAFPNAPYGSIHRDSTFGPRKNATVFFALQDIGPEQGPTEYWLGTHLDLPRPSVMKLAHEGIRSIRKYVRGDLAGSYLLSDIAGEFGRETFQIPGRWKRPISSGWNRLNLAARTQEYRCCAAVGDAYLADYAILHRGGVNLSSTPRRVLYIGFGCKGTEEPNYPWLVDLPSLEREKLGALSSLFPNP